MIEIADASEAHLGIIRQIAEKTWWPTYSTVLAPKQIRYMLDTIYDLESLKRVLQDGTQKFILLKDGAGYQAFAAYGVKKEEPDVYKLYKIYVLPENQGKGFGAFLINEIKNRLLTKNIRILDLNVNRYNNARHFYEKMGFTCIREEDIAIGPYWMNDFVMRLRF